MRRLLTVGLTAVMAAVLLGWYGPPLARADATFIVNSTGDAGDFSAGDGTCETGSGNGICTLRAAIQEANALGGTDTIVLPVGPITLSGASGEDAAASGDLDITSNININGSSATGTIIIGSGDRVFHIIGTPTVNISSVTIRDGSGVTNGGGIYMVGGALTINSSIIGVSMHGNAATASGGGIYQEGGSLTINSTTVGYNTATVSGGGVYVAGGSLTVNNSTFGPSNMAGAGAGVYVPGGATATINNSTFSGNGTSGGAGTGGAIFSSGTVNLNNATLASNSATAAGGGVYQLGGSVNIRNTLLATNTAPVGNNCSGTVVSLGYNLVGDIDGCSGVANGVNGDLAGSTLGSTVINPQIMGLANNGGLTNTRALLSNSPALDAGNPSGCGNGSTFSNDQRGAGYPRHVDGDVNGSTICDIGAYELPPIGFTVTPSETFTPTITNTPAPTDTSAPTETPTLTETPGPTAAPTATPTPTTTAEPGGKLPASTGAVVSGTAAGGGAAGGAANGSSVTLTVQALQTLAASSPTATISPEESDLTSTAQSETAVAQAPTLIPTPTLLPTITPTFSLPAEDVSLSTSRIIGMDGGVVSCGIWYVGVQSLTVAENSVFRCETISPEDEADARLPLNYRPFWHIVDIDATDAGGQALSLFNPPLNVCAYYADSYLDAIGGDPSRLVIYTAESASRQWTALTTTVEDGVPRVCAESDRLSLFRLVAEPSPLVGRLTSPLALIIGGAVCLLLTIVVVIILVVVARRGSRRRAEAEAEAEAASATPA